MRVQNINKIRVVKLAVRSSYFRKASPPPPQSSLQLTPYCYGIFLKIWILWSSKTSACSNCSMRLSKWVGPATGAVIVQKRISTEDNLLHYILTNKLPYKLQIFRKYIVMHHHSVSYIFSKSQIATLSLVTSKLQCSLQIYHVHTTFGENRSNCAGTHTVIFLT